MSIASNLLRKKEYVAYDSFKLDIAISLEIAQTNLRQLTNTYFEATALSAVTKAQIESNWKDIIVLLNCTLMHINKTIDMCELIFDCKSENIKKSQIEKIKKIKRAEKAVKKLFF